MGFGRPIASLLRQARWSHWLAAVWIAGVVFFWWQRVPIEPEVVIPLKDRTRAWGYTAAGDVVVSHGRQGSTNDNQRTGGPVDVVSSTTGKVVAERLKKGDYILAVSQRHIAGADLEQIRIVDFESGKTVFSTPAGSAYPSAVFSFDGERIAVARGRQITMYSVESGELLWTRKLIAGLSRPLTFEEPAQVRSVKLYSPFHGILTISLGFNEHAYLRCEDGQSDSRFGRYDHVDESPEGQLAIVARGAEVETELPLRFNGMLEAVKGRTVAISPKGQSVYDLEASRSLWEMEGELNWRRFSPDSKEIWEFSSLGGQPTMRRWRAVDGSLIAGQDSPLERKAHGGIASRDARYLLTWTKAPGLHAPSWLQKVCKEFGSRWDGEIRPAREELVLIDQKTAMTRLVMSPTGSKRDGGSLENVTGGPPVPERFTVHLKDRILVYRFDTPRNWLWLLCAGPGLVSLAIGVSQAWTLLRRRLSSPAALVEDIAG